MLAAFEEEGIVQVSALLGCPSQPAVARAAQSPSASWGYFQLLFLWGTCLSFQPRRCGFLH